jgi:hypothetical protein
VWGEEELKGEVKTIFGGAIKISDLRIGSKRLSETGFMIRSQVYAM